jgi:hypothetical protein
MQTRITRDAALYRFDSLRALSRYIEETAPTWRATESRDADAEHSWDLSAGYAGAVRMAREGWIEGAQRQQRALAALAPTRTSPRNVMGVYGSRPSIPAYCAGAPRHMVRRIEKPMGARRVVTLIVPTNAMYSVSAASMANFGVAVVQYVRQLEASGTRVELMGAICSEVSGQRCAHVWTVKRADQPLDLGVTAFSIGHPAMFRRLGLALRERSACKETPGYGNSKDLTLADVINAPRDAIILNGMRNADQYAPTPEDGLRYVERVVNAALAAQRG